MMVTPGLPDFQKLIDYRIRIETAVKAPNTRESYAVCYKRFVEWCGRANRCPFPASTETVILYLTDGLIHNGRISSARAYVNAINDAHHSAHVPPPDLLALRRFLTAAQRLRQEKPAKKKALRVEDLRQICALLLESGRPRDIRDRAVLLLGFATALRRSSIAALDLQDLRWEARGLVVVVQRSKTDQKGEGRLIGVAPGEHAETDVIGAVRNWLEIRGDRPGALFRTINYPHGRLHARNVALIVKAGIRSIGLDPKDYSGHSIRSGFATSSLGAGVGELTVMRTTGHTSVTSPSGYLREADPLRFLASSKLGL